MFKALLLQQWCALSDAELEEALSDRLSFRRLLTRPFFRDELFPPSGPEFFQMLVAPVGLPEVPVGGRGCRCAGLADDALRVRSNEQSCRTEPNCLIPVHPA
jgi:hypothetical protein